MADGADAGLVALAGVKGELGDHHLLHATRAELLRRLGRVSEAREAYEQAIAFASEGSARVDLRRRLASVDAPASSVVSISRPAVSGR